MVQPKARIAGLQKFFVKSRSVVLRDIVRYNVPIRSQLTTIGVRWCIVIAIPSSGTPAVARKSVRNLKIYLKKGQGVLEERHHDVALWRQSSCSASQRFSWEDLEQPPTNSDVRIGQVPKGMVKDLRQADFLMVLLRSYRAEELVAYP